MLIRVISGQIKPIANRYSIFDVRYSIFFSSPYALCPLPFASFFGLPSSVFQLQNSLFIIHYSIFNIRNSLLLLLFLSTTEPPAGGELGVAKFTQNVQRFQFTQIIRPISSTSKKRRFLSFLVKNEDEIRDKLRQATSNYQPNLTTKNTKNFTKHTNNYTAPKSQIVNHYSMFDVRYSTLCLLPLVSHVSGTAYFAVNERNRCPLRLTRYALSPLPPALRFLLRSSVFGLPSSVFRLLTSDLFYH